MLIEKKTPTFPDQQYRFEFISCNERLCRPSPNSNVCVTRGHPVFVLSRHRLVGTYGTYGYRKTGRIFSILFNTIFRLFSRRYANIAVRCPSAGPPANRHAFHVRLAVRPDVPMVFRPSRLRSNVERTTLHGDIIYFSLARLGDDRVRNKWTFGDSHHVAGIPRARFARRPRTFSRGFVADFWPKN